jgi:hypothetical protein
MKRISSPGPSLMTGAVLAAKEQAETSGNGGFVPKSVLRLPGGGADILFMPWRGVEEKRAMSEELRAHARRETRSPSRRCATPISPAWSQSRFNPNRAHN